MAAFVIKVREDNGDILPGASVGIFDLNGGAIMSAVSDIEGFALLVTDEVEVRVRASLQEYTFPNNIVLSPEDGESYNLYGNLNGTTPPVDSHICRVYGQIVDPLGGELPDRWRIKVTRVGTVGDSHSYDIVTGAVNVNHYRGAVSLDLVRGGSYRIGPLPITRYGDTDFEDMNYADISVPDRSTARLVDLIAPRAVSVTAAQAPTAKINQTVSISISTTLSDDTVAAQSSVYLASSVESLNIQASVKGNSLDVKCSEAGTYTVKLNANIDASQLEGVFYRPCAEKTLLQIEVECEP